MQEAQTYLQTVQNFYTKDKLGMAYGMSAEKKIISALANLMGSLELCFHYPVIMLGKRTISDIPGLTANTDGLNENYGREFINALPIPEVLFVIMHEGMHKEFCHLKIWRKLWAINHGIANAALDYVSNGMLIDMITGSVAVSKIMQPIKIAHTPGGTPELGMLYDPKYRAMNGLQVFQDLMKKQEQEPDEPDDEDEEDEPEDGDEGEDGDPKAECDEDGEDSDGDGDGEEGDEAAEGSDGDEGEEEAAGGSARRRKRSSGVSPGKLLQDWRNLQFDAHKLDEPDTDLTDIEDKVSAAVFDGGQLARMRGAKVPNGFYDVAVKKPNWIDALRDFWQQAAKGDEDTTYRKFNSRMLSIGEYYPTTLSESAGNYVIAVDSSASTEMFLRKFLEHVQTIAVETQPESVTLLYWDDCVQSSETYTPTTYGTLAASTRPVGFGGTTVSCVPEYLKEFPAGREIAAKMDCVIVLTDGEVGDKYGDWTGINLLWCVHHSSNYMAKYFKPPCGMVMDITE